ncbi:MAG TPA: GGDEF domain-containing protein [Thermosulfurimonas dismutans]|uniref:diguanylate cyclase n=1 Tax=Thermosulfurimonas dismutans TaxID=999894 RepID=A0A7C3CQJ1_9BACT|nr:GGDEF domain-containing protein [Thermosulfurimonas dismutans]
MPQLPEIGWNILRELLTSPLPPDLRQKVETLKKAYEVLYHEYSKDFLTGLYNRRSFEEELVKMVELSRREETPFTLFLLDIDHFKRINDTYGHEIGDQVLAGVGRTLLRTLRKTDFAARYGGEEFAVILPGLGFYRGMGVARRIKAALESLKFTTPRGTVSITVSIGGAVFRPDYRLGPKEFLREVDQLLYAAKNLGRRTIVFKPELEPHTEGLTLEERALLFRKDEKE